MDDTVDFVKDYYGKVLQKTSDLKTNACTTVNEKIPERARDIAALIHDEVIQRYYGCGLVLPEAPLVGARVLDLGCGAGRDCFMLSALVGEVGQVTGLDMTEEMLEVARRHEGYHQRVFNYSRSNTRFLCGYIERLKEAGVDSDFYDLVISNCVVNLTKDKDAVFREVFAVLKEGGEFYFSDVYSEKELSADLRSEKVLWGECIAGALSWREMHQLALKNGFQIPRLVRAAPVTVDNPQLQLILGDHKFASVTYRLFKLSAHTSNSCHVIYNGGISGFESSLRFDYTFEFEKDKLTHVDAATAAILRGSRFAEYFSFHSEMDEVPSTNGSEKHNDELINPFQLVNERCAGQQGKKCCC